MPETTADDVLAAERDHLAQSRVALRWMHDSTDAHENALAGDFVSTQVLKQALYRRRQSLIDQPDVPLFFGRIDYTRAQGADEDETHHIGRRHVTAEYGGEPLVVDWRAPVALPFYRANAADAMGIDLRRRFGFSHGELTAYEDEHLALGEDRTSEILTEEIERPRTGPMRDIVATIQPEQDVLVRADLEDSLCIQGAPGTGKTAVGLHRAAFLLYAFRERLSRQGVLVVGPNDSFLSYIGDVLPALGEIDATQETVASLLEKSTGLTIKTTDDDATAVLKGDPRMAELIARALWSNVREATELLAVPSGARVWRVPAPVVNEAVASLRARGVRYEAGRQMLPQVLAHHVLVRREAAGEACDDRHQNAVARSKPVKEMVAALWPQVTAKQLLFRLFTDAAFLRDCADGLLTDEEQARLLWAKPPRSAGSAKWSLADVVLADEADDQLTRIGSLGHVIIDEAQDLSAMQLRAVGRRASTGSVTLLGDLAQATTAWASTSWAESLAHLGKPATPVHELTAGFRVPAEVIDYAARLLPVIAPGLTKPHSVRHARGQLDLREVAAPVKALPRTVAELATREGTVGVIVPDAQVAAARKALSGAGVEHKLLGEDVDFDSPVDVVPASLAKGLEFDHVCLLDPASIVAGEADEVTGLRRLYVCLTRAVTTLIVLHTGDLPEQLRDAS